MKRIWIMVVLALMLVVGAVWALWPRGGQGLVLYSAVDYGDTVAAAFTRKTGIPVRVITLSTGALLARISAEGHRPAWTLAWFDGDLAADALDQAGLLARHTLPHLAWNAEGRALLPADGSYTPTGLTLAGAFTYRKADLAHPPRTWSDLTRADLRNAIGMNNPAISGPMYPMLAGMLQLGGGWPDGQREVTALKANGLHVYAKNANTLAALKSGDIKVAITQSSAAWYMAAQDPSLQVVIPRPSFALPSVLMVSAGTHGAKQQAAERFIRFAMAPATQRLRMHEGESDGYYWPLTSDAPAPIGDLPPLQTLAVETLKPGYWGPLESRVNRWFSKAIVGQ